MYQNVNYNQPQQHLNPFDTPIGSYGGYNSSQPHLQTGSLPSSGPNFQLPPASTAHLAGDNGNPLMTSIGDSMTGEKLPYEDEVRVKKILDCDLYLNTLNMFLFALPCAVTVFGLVLTLWFFCFWISSIFARRNYKSLNIPPKKKQSSLRNYANLRVFHMGFLSCSVFLGLAYCLFFMALTGSLDNPSRIQSIFGASTVWVILGVATFFLTLIGQIAYLSSTQGLLFVAATLAYI